jgi:hypothetical protein
MGNTAAASPRDAAISHTGTVEVGTTPAQRIAAFVASVEEALLDEAVVFRVGQAGVLIRLDFTDYPVQPVFLALDEHPPRATVAALPRRADVVLTMTSADLNDCLRQGEELPLRILRGDIRFEGYVRKFLRVLPVLRAAVQANDDARRAAQATPPS